MQCRNATVKWSVSNPPTRTWVVIKSTVRKCYLYCLLVIVCQRTHNAAFQPIGYTPWFSSLSLDLEIDSYGLELMNPAMMENGTRGAYLCTCDGELILPTCIQTTKKTTFPKRPEALSGSCHCKSMFPTKSVFCRRSPRL